MAVTRTYIGSAASTSDLTTYTFSSVPIGSAAADRMVVVVAGGSSGSNRTVNSVTIGGVSAELIVASASLQAASAIFALMVPSDTTANIVVAFSGAMSQCVINVYNINGLGSVTAYDSDTAGSNSGSTTRNVSIDVPNDGTIIAGSTLKNNETSIWTNVTENYDAITDTVGFTAASAQSLGAQTGRTITVTHNNSAFSSLVAASWGATAQTVTQSSRYDDSDTLYAGTVTKYNTVQAPFIPSPEDFFAGDVIPGAVSVQAPFIDNASDDFYDAVVQKYNSVEAPFLDGSTNTFYGGVIVQGTTVVAPYLDDSADTFYEGELLLGGVTLHAPFIANVDTFYTHLIQHIVRPALFSNANTFYGGQVNRTAYAPFLNDGDTFYAGVIQKVVYAPFFDDSADTFYGPTINRTIYAPFLSSAVVFYGGLVGFGQTITAPLFVDGDTFYGGVVTVTGFNRMWHKDAEDGWQQHDWHYRMYSEWRAIDAGWYKTEDGWQQFYAKTK